MASTQTTILGPRGKFRCGFYGGGGRGYQLRTGVGEAIQKVCEQRGTVTKSDSFLPLPHSAGTGGLHVGYQQNRRRGKAAKAIL